MKEAYIQGPFAYKNAQQNRVFDLASLHEKEKNNEIFDSCAFDSIYSPQ